MLQCWVEMSPQQVIYVCVLRRSAVYFIPCGQVTTYDMTDRWLLCAVNDIDHSVFLSHYC